MNPGDHRLDSPGSNTPSGLRHPRPGAAAGLPPAATKEMRRREGGRKEGGRQAGGEEREISLLGGLLIWMAV